MSEPTYHEGVLEFQQGMRFEFGDDAHTLCTAITIRYCEWDGAWAGIYAEHPLLKQRLNFGPNLNSDDPTQDRNAAGLDILSAMAQTYHRAITNPTDKNTVTRKELAKYFN